MGMHGLWRPATAVVLTAAALVAIFNLEWLLPGVSNGYASSPGSADDDDTHIMDSLYDLGEGTGSAAEVPTKSEYYNTGFKVPQELLPGASYPNTDITIGSASASESESDSEASGTSLKDGPGPLSSLPNSENRDGPKGSESAPASGHDGLTGTASGRLHGYFGAASGVEACERQAVPPTQGAVLRWPVRAATQPPQTPLRPGGGDVAAVWSVEFCTHSATPAAVTASVRVKRVKGCDVERGWAEGTSSQTVGVSHPSHALLHE